jgi:hypothetical protein
MYRLKRNPLVVLIVLLMMMCRMTELEVPRQRLMIILISERLKRIKTTESELDTNERVMVLAQVYDKIFGRGLFNGQRMRVFGGCLLSTNRNGAESWVLLDLDSTGNHVEFYATGRKRAVNDVLLAFHHGALDTIDSNPTSRRVRNII